MHVHAIISIRACFRPMSHIQTIPVAPLSFLSHVMGLLCKYFVQQLIHCASYVGCVLEGF